MIILCVNKMPIIVKLASRVIVIARTTIIPRLVLNVTICWLVTLAALTVILSAKCEKLSQNIFPFHLYQCTILLLFNGYGPAHLINKFEKNNSKKQEIQIL